MPHITLEYTNNTSLPADANDLLLSIHHTLEELGNIKINNCKSRVIRLDNFLIANNDKEEGFVNLEIVLGSGRSEEDKAKISRQCLELLKSAFLPIAEVPIQITVNVGEIPLPLFSKYSDTTPI